MPDWLQQLLKDHGPWAAIAAFLMAVVFGYVPSPISAIAKHVERDANREAVLVRICLNTAQSKEASDLCWSALTSGQPGGHP